MFMHKKTQCCQNVSSSQLCKLYAVPIKIPASTLWYQQTGSNVYMAWWKALNSQYWRRITQLENRNPQFLGLLWSCSNQYSVVRELNLVLCDSLEGWNGLRVGGKLKREGAYVHLWLIHAIIWQKPMLHCKAIIFQLN